MYTSNNDTRYFIFPESCVKVFERLGEQDKVLALEYMKAIMDYGLERKKPDEDSPLWTYGLGCAFSLIDDSCGKKWQNLSRGNDYWNN